LDDFLSLLKTFQTCGLQSWDTFVVGLPYSSKGDVVQDLSYICGHVQAPHEYADETFKIEIREALMRIYAHCLKKGGRFIVVEDGGYVARLLRDRDPQVDPDWGSLCTGIVEQTTNGIRVTQYWQANLGDFVAPPNVPVVNVAETALKLEGESPLIGRAVVFNIKRLLDGYEESDLSGKAALVVGYGNVGREIANTLVSEGCIVSVSDADSARTAKLPSTLSLAANPVAAAQEMDFVIGSTGRGIGIPNKDDRPPFDSETAFLGMRHEAVLINASSKRCEFNWDAIGNITRSRSARRGFGHERTLTNGTKLRIAADGFPVNFYNSQSAPAEKMQTVLAMLFMGAPVRDRRILEGRSAAHRLHLQAPVTLMGRPRYRFGESRCKMDFSDRLNQAVLQKNSRLMVGLDPILDLFPSEIWGMREGGFERAEAADAIALFLIGILDAIADLAVAVKPQVAFFERLGAPGFAALEKVVKAAKARDLIVVCDCKRGDIGSTAVAYADYYLGPQWAGVSAESLEADAVTVNPYLGVDSLEPFVSHIPAGRGVFVLAKTSNPGSADLQDRLVTEDGSTQPVYGIVAALAGTLAERFPVGELGYYPIGLVVGATFPRQAVELRRRFPRLPFLIPGIGAQGGKTADVRECFDDRGLGAVINASRSILFAYRENDRRSHWKDAARLAAAALKDEINVAIDG
jgi:orotidine-5'-phosphate decarboxylase